MNTQQFKQWLSSQQPKLDAIIANAGRKYWVDHRRFSNFGFDLNECQHESYNLIRQKDLCYDRPNTAFAYSLWYHARRINTFLSHFGARMIEANAPTINVFDLGAGTGAVQWSIGLFVAFAKANGERVPKFRLVNVDISPFMLEYNRDYLWPTFLRDYPEVENFIMPEYVCNSWMNTVGHIDGETWLSASYLFDISDADEDSESNYSTAVQQNFKELIEVFNPTKTLLLTSDQPKKKQLQRKVVDEISTKGYIVQQIETSNLWMYGNLQEVSALRRELHTAYNPFLLGTEGQALANQTSWRDGSFISCCLTKQQQTLLEPTRMYGQQRTEVSLFNPPIRVRRDVKLNAEQLKAAAHSDRHTIITGPAGCGKSVVITERVKNLVDAKNYDPNLRVLVSTFNKELIGYLLGWIVDLLDRTKFRRSGEYIYFNGSTVPNITCWHFDVLPTRIGGIYGELIFENGLKQYAAKAIEEIKAESKITHNRYDSFLNPGYVVEEYHRVIYGLQYTKEDEFQVGKRKGRVPRLNTNGASRKILWEVCMRFLQKLQASPYDSIITKRHKLLKQLISGALPFKYTHIFIDEYQDCTEADYMIFDRLLTDSENLVMAGDFAQAVHLGQAAELPRLSSHADMGRRLRIKLKGSYRLPYRVSEAISPLSKLIQDGNIITPFKAAPPGSRPIVLSASDDATFGAKFSEVFRRYKVYGVEGVTILEKDSATCSLIRSTGITADTDTILRLKGMEKPFILWSTRADIEHPDDAAEFVYTILSRTSCVLVIALFPTTLRRYYGVLQHLNAERLIFWDKESKETFNRFRNTQQEERLEDLPED